MNLYGWLWYYGSSCLWILELTVTLLSYQWSSWRLLLLSQIKTLLNFGFKCLWMEKSAKVVPPIARLVCIIYMMHAMAFFKVSIFFAGFLSLREIQKKKTGSEIPKWCGLDQFLKGLFLICENLFQCGQNSVH